MLLQLIHLVKPQFLGQGTVKLEVFFLGILRHNNPPSATIDGGIALIFNLSYACLLRKDQDDSSRANPVAFAPLRL